MGNHIFYKLSVAILAAAGLLWLPACEEEGYEEGVYQEQDLGEPEMEQRAIEPTEPEIEIQQQPVQPAQPDLQAPEAPLPPPPTTAPQGGDLNQPQPGAGGVQQTPPPAPAQ